MAINLKMDEMDNLLEKYVTKICDTPKPEKDTKAPERICTSSV